MTKDPILVLQMRRMGDLILTFPLLLELASVYPDHPLYVAAEPRFYKDLVPFAPQCSFFPPDSLPRLGAGKFEAVINLSSQREAAECAAKARAGIKAGPLFQEGTTRIAGFWQLYRAALTENNRHNLFHWADLFRLDNAKAAGPLWRRKTQMVKSRIAFFIGASEPSKRPDAPFWISLARILKSRGKTPVVLGGPEEKGMGEAIGRAANVPSFAGKTSLAQLAALLGSAELVITPDTGPMHLADWLGVPVLNLSLGNVSPHETGPFSAGQWIAQANLSCAGCWRCWRGRQYCRPLFSAQSIANAALEISAGRGPLPTPGLRFWKSGRDRAGLYFLEPQNQKDTAASLLDRFWKEVFLSLSGLGEIDRPKEAAVKLFTNYPRLMENLQKHLGSMVAVLASCQKKGVFLPDGFWKSHPWHSRLFAGFSQMRLQNNDYSRQSWQVVLQDIELLREIFSSFS